MQATNITVVVPGMLRDQCGGARELKLDPAGTVRAALADIERRHPGLYRSVCDETGRVRPHVGVFVGMDHIRDREGLDTTLAAGDVITILPSVSGG
jgi:molybdopterin converting factor small subunit